MLTFNLPTVTETPFELELADFTPALEYHADFSYLPFMFGNALVMINMIKLGEVTILSNYDEEEEIWQNVVHGTCTFETVAALEEFYRSAV